MRAGVRLLIHALLYNYDNNLQYSDASYYTIVDVDNHPPFAIAHSQNGFKIKLGLDYGNQLRREPLPPASVMKLIEAIRPNTIDELRDIAYPPPKQKTDNITVLYLKYLKTDPAEEVVVKDGEIFIMGWTVEEFVRLCPMRFQPMKEEREFIQGLVDAINDAVHQITRGRGYPRGGPSRISIQVSHVHRLLTAVSRLPGIDINPKSRH